MWNIYDTVYSDPIDPRIHVYAESSYVQAVKYIEYDSSFGDEEKKQAKALKVACNLNEAACKLKLKEYKEAEKLCTKVRKLTKHLLFFFLQSWCFCRVYNLC